LLAVLLRRTFEAAEATFLLVLSDFAMDVASFCEGRRTAVRRRGTMSDSVSLRSRTQGTSASVLTRPIPLAESRTR
jgi:hypothetical protein